MLEQKFYHPMENGKSERSFSQTFIESYLLFRIFFPKDDKYVVP